MDAVVTEARSTLDEEAFGDAQEAGAQLAAEQNIARAITRVVFPEHW